MTLPNDAGPGNGHFHSGHYECPPFPQRAVDEETPLLAAPDAYCQESSPEEAFDDELEVHEIDPDDFNNMIQRSTSYTSGLGIEPESQESPLLRGPRTYSRARRSASVSATSGGRRSIGGNSGRDDEAVIEEDEERKQSPFRGGVSVGRFWLIYSGILANLVRRDLNHAANGADQHIVCRMF